MADGALVFRPPARGRTGRLALGIPLSLIVVGVSIFAAAVFWVPHGIVCQIDAGRLTIRYGMRLLESTRAVALDEILSAERVRVGRGRKVMGTNLPGYCAGRFRYPELGEVWQATDCSGEGVLVRTSDDDRPWLLSAPDPEAFLKALETGGPYRGEVAPASVGQEFGLIKVAMVLPLLLAAVVPLLFFVGPSRLCYRVVPGGVEVSTLLRRRRFETVGATARRHRPKPGIRLWGSGMPGYYTGWFLLDGRRCRVYATGFDDGILLEGQRLRLFVNPAEPAAFLEALGSAGGVLR